ncbi:hypothetical protein GBAR_LOCUS10757, partial [Geodia barretti]
SKYLVFCLALLCLVSFVFYTKRFHWYCSPRAAQELVPVQISPAVVVNAACSSPVVRRPAGGLVVAFRFWEQQTQAMKSLVQLQCLASRMGLRVVEPFLYGSLLGLQPEALNGEGYPHLSELVDVDVWNRETTSKFGLFPLVKWSEFIRIPAPGFSYTAGCPAACFDKFNKSVTALAQYGRFIVVRRACVNFLDYAGV